MSDQQLDDLMELIAQANDRGVHLSFDQDDLVVKVQESHRADPYFLSALKANKKRLREYFQKYKQDEEVRQSASTLRARPGNSLLSAPLSFAQERLWFIDQLQGSTQYHIPLTFRFTAALNKPCLEQALLAIINRHEVLRSIMIEEEGRASQQVMTATGWSLRHIEYENTNPSKEALFQYIDALIAMPFDLSRDYMLRAWLLHLDNGEYMLVIVVHHIAFDGWSVAILTDELQKLYKAFVNKRLPSLPPLAIQYADYAIWQRQHLNNDSLATGLQYWKQQLAGLEVLDMPLDHPRPARQSSRGGIVRLKLPNELSQQIIASCQQQQVTLFMFLLAVYKILLFRYSTQQDICVGCPVAGRSHSEVEPLIGFFVNTLVFRSQIEPDQRFDQFLQQLKNTTLQAYEHQDVPFEKIVEALAIPRDMSRSPVFQVMFSLRQQTGVRSSIDVNALQPDDTINATQAKFDLSLEAISSEEGIELALIYSSDLYSHQSARKLLDHFLRLLRETGNHPARSIASLPMLSQEEEARMIQFSQGPIIPFTGINTLIEGFELQAARKPHQPALFWEQQSLTYGQLNEQATTLARWLLQYHTQPEDRIALFTGPGPWMITAMLAVLKTAAAYVPIDVDYPTDRIAYVLQDAAIATILTTSDMYALLPSAGNLQIVQLDTAWDQINSYQSDVQLPAVQPHQLAYMIYTSGSTGRPKGVMIEHQSIMNRLRWGQQYFNPGHTDAVLQKTTYCFDISVWEIFWPLMQGCRLVLAKRFGAADTAYLKELIQQQQLSVVHFVPSMLEVFLHDLEPGECASVRHLLCSGEALKPAHVNLFARKLPTATIHNLYGPTEASVEVTCWSHAASQGPVEYVPIGKPIANTQLYILNQAAQLCPPGVAGELHIGGIQLARGYWGRKDLTQKAFILNPFNTAGRLYKTGDRCRWNAQGEIEFLGRNDEQLKLHGYRIEPGEIEAVLREADGVEQALVMVVQNKSTDTKRIAAFVAGRQLPGKETILQQAAARLPAYMVPAEIILLAQLPVTLNGKVNKQELIQLIDNQYSQQQRQYVAPRNQTEEQLVTIWQQLLNRQNIGIHDNFFELGGDSIITIQVVSQVRRVGYQLHPRDIFTQQTIARLAAFLTAARINEQTAGEQGLLTGSCGLLPLQQWFLEKGSVQPHFNQNVLIAIDKDITPQSLNEAVQLLLAHHDALRFQYSKENGYYTQYYDSEPGALITEDLSHFNPQEWIPELSSRGQRWQESTGIGEGQLCRFVLFTTPAAETHHRLLIIIHHIAVDGVSWRIILEDLGLLVKALKQGQPASLGFKTASCRQWHHALAAYGQKRQLKEQLPYWENAMNGVYRLPVDKQHTGPWTFGHMHKLSALLDQAHTQQLLQQVPAAYHTEVDDILLTALATTLQQWVGHTKSVIGMEGHGRENIDDQLDISRTVGWFAAMYPVALQLETAAGAGDRIKSIKEQLRAVPLKGIGYGILKYINKEESLQREDPWEIMFNYLGQIDNVIKKDTGIKGVSEPAGNPISSAIEWKHKIEITAIITRGQLHIQWYYSTLHFEDTTIRALAENYLDQLREIIAHCAGRQQPGHTPADFGLSAEITWRELDSFLDQPAKGATNRSTIERIYRLSPLQKGILFHSLMGKNTGAYTDQMVVDINQLHTELFTQTWHLLGKRLSILRTGFCHDTFRIPVQVVYKEVAIPLELIDLRHLPAKEQEQYIRRFEEEDLIRGFDFEQAPLMRVTLLQLSDQLFRMIWTHHHLILDGWSGPLLIDEFVKIYQALLAGAHPATEGDDRFEDYIRYIERKDRYREQQYWRNYLSTLKESTLLPFIKHSAARTKKVAAFNVINLHIERSDTQLIQTWARQHHLTVNTIMQGVWAFLLQQYTGNPQVSFGVVVSGRPADLPAMERRIGMYINTLPFLALAEPAKPVIEWLQAIQQQQLQSREYQYTSLNDIQDWTGITGDLFDTTLSYQNFPVSPAGPATAVAPQQQQGLQVQKVNVNEKTSNYPLSLRITERDRINIQFIYKDTLLQEQSIKMISEHFRHVLMQFTTGTTVSLEEIKLILPAEEKQLFQFSSPGPQGTHAPSIIEAFDQQVAARPAACALVYADRSLTYQELDRYSNQLAHYLRSSGVGAGTPVPLCAARGIEMIVAIFAILKAGGAYIPIDPGYPSDRISFILQDAQAPLALCSRQYKALFDHLPQAIVLENPEHYAAYPDSTPDELPLPASLCYIIYTSGSTGIPKGVMIEHHSLVNMIRNQAAPLSLRPGIRVLQFASLGFDASCYEIFGTLLHGGSLVLIDRADLLDEARFLHLIRQHQIELLTLPPSYLALMSRHPASLKTIVSAGESLNEEIARLVIKSGIKLINAYGPTENAVCSTLSESPLKKDGTVTIGKPQDNTKVYILNERLQPVPMGVEGELYLAGSQLARGYWNRPALDAEKFITHAFHGQEPQRLYRTGDAGYWLPDGDIVFTGRRDEQVKIRGHRVEPGEIENVLQQCELVQQAVVLLKDDVRENRQLLAYIIAEAFDKEAITAFLKTRLPDYMIPSGLLQVQHIPLTPSGKVDKKALLSITHANRLNSEGQPPRNPIEQKLWKIWCDALGAKAIGIQDNFFELGGNSMIMLLVLNLCRKQGWELQIDDLFTYQTIETLAACLQQQSQQEAPGAASHLLPLNAAVGRPIAFVIPGMIGHCDVYRQLGSQLEATYTVYGLQMMGVLANEDPLTSLEAITAQNLQWIRAVQPHGPYRFIAHSFGMYIAFEMTRQLEAMGETVEYVAALDITATPVQTPLATMHQPTWLLNLARYYFHRFHLIDDPAPAWAIPLEKKLQQHQPGERIGLLLDHAGEYLTGKEASIRMIGSLLRLRYQNEQIDCQPRGSIQAPILLFKAGETTASHLHPDWGWAAHTHTVKTFEVPGNHFTMVENDHAGTLAGLLTNYLEPKDEKQDKAYSKTEQ